MAAQAACGEAGHDVRLAIALSQRFQADLLSHEMRSGWSSSTMTSKTNKRPSGDVSTAAKIIKTAAARANDMTRRLLIGRV